MRAAAAALVSSSLRSTRPGVAHGRGARLRAAQRRRSRRESRTSARVGQAPPRGGRARRARAGRALRDDRVAPVVEADVLGQELGAQAVRVAGDRVDPEVVTRLVTRPPDRTWAAASRVPCSAVQRPAPWRSISPAKTSSRWRKAGGAVGVAARSAAGDVRPPARRRAGRAARATCARRVEAAAMAWSPWRQGPHWPRLGGEIAEDAGGLPDSAGCVAEEPEHAGAGRAGGEQRVPLAQREAVHAPGVEPGPPSRRPAAPGDARSCRRRTPEGRRARCRRDLIHARASTDPPSVTRALPGCPGEPTTEPLRAVAGDQRHVGQRLHVADERRAVRTPRSNGRGGTVEGARGGR